MATTRTDPRGNPFYSMLKKRRQSPSASSAVSSLKTSDDPVSFLDQKGFEPTEVDLTETEQNEETTNSSLDNDDDDDQAVIVPHNYLLSSSEKILKTAETIQEHPDEHQHHHGNDHQDGCDDDDDDEHLMKVETIVDMLAEVNEPDAYSRRRRLKDPNRSLEMEDLTKILQHVNICEEAETDPRWDVIHELAYGDHGGNNSREAPRGIKPKSRPQREETMVEGMFAMDVRSSGSSRLPRLSEHTDEDYEETNDNSNTGKQENNHGYNSHESDSLSLGDVVANAPEENGSAFTLDANTHSVDSSVTWYEGADITEIVLSEDDLEEFLPNYNHDGDYDEDDDDDNDEEGFSGASTPPPPPGHGILYTLPPMDSASLGEEDSLSRCYRRRHPRRYAHSE